MVWGMAAFFLLDSGAVMGIFTSIGQNFLILGDGIREAFFGVMILIKGGCCSLTSYSSI